MNLSYNYYQNVGLKQAQQAQQTNQIYRSNQLLENGGNANYSHFMAPSSNRPNYIYERQRASPTYVRLIPVSNKQPSQSSNSKSINANYSCDSIANSHAYNSNTTNKLSPAKNYNVSIVDKPPASGTFLRNHPSFMNEYRSNPPPSYNYAINNNKNNMNEIVTERNSNVKRFTNESTSSLYHSRETLDRLSYTRNEADGNSNIYDNNFREASAYQHKTFHDRESSGNNTAPNSDNKFSKSINYTEPNHKNSSGVNFTRQLAATLDHQRRGNVRGSVRPKRESSVDSFQHGGGGDMSYLNQNFASARQPGNPFNTVRQNVKVIRNYEKSYDNCNAMYNNEKNVYNNTNQQTSISNNTHSKIVSSTNEINNMITKISHKYPLIEHAESGNRRSSPTNKIKIQMQNIVPSQQVIN
jgi:hypothetical protein